MGRENLLMFGDTQSDANMLYAVGMFVPDPFIFIQADGVSHIVMNDLEIDRARKQAKHCHVFSLKNYQDRLRRKKGGPVGFAPVIKAVIADLKIKRLLVPSDFPHGLAKELRNLKIKVKIKEGSFFPEREIKTSDEVKKISAALMMAEVGLAEGIQVLKSSKIGRNRSLLYRNNPLTSEKLRAIIDIAILQAGGLASHTIVAGGLQGCDPHERGHGPLQAHEPIILDVFPRSQKTGYFGDITRTVVRGRASEAVRRLYATVSSGQEIAFRELKDKSSAVSPHQAVEAFFAKAGYKSGKRNGRMEGFFHGTGHGLGLELHEGPRLSSSSVDTLRAGQVVTVEPGLYYAGTGGVRLEDVALVTAGKARNLTKFEKVLEI